MVEYVKSEGCSSLPKSGRARVGNDLGEGSLSPLWERVRVRGDFAVGIEACSMCKSYPSSKSEISILPQGEDICFSGLLRLRLAMK